MRIVIALGGNALLRRSDPMTTEMQRRNVAIAARAIATLAAEPRRVLEIEPIMWLLERGAVVICAGGGGIPTMLPSSGPRELVGVEAVIDKDLAGELLAEDVRADLFLMATDVDGVYIGWGTPEQCKINCHGGAIATPPAAPAPAAGQSRAAGGAGTTGYPAARSKEPNQEPTIADTGPHWATASHHRCRQMPQQAMPSTIQPPRRCALQARGRWFEPSCARQEQHSERDHESGQTRRPLAWNSRLPG